jgi:thymidylate synthase
MKQYIDLCNHILNNGRVRKDRTGTGTISIFGYQNECVCPP